MPFRALLTDLVARAPYARGAIFCDYEGENVDLAIAQPQPAGCGPLSEYDLKVCGAQVAAAWMRLLETARANGAGLAEELKLSCAAGTLLCRSVSQGYYLMLLLAPGPRAGAASFVLRNMATLVRREF